MKSIKTQLTLMAALALLTFATQAAGTARTFNSTQIFSTVGAGHDEGEPVHCGESGGNSQWYSYQPETNGILIINTDGSSFNTVLAVYTAVGFDLGSLTSVACDNSSSGNGGDRVIFAATQGTIYYIAVDGVGGASGTVQLNIILGDAPTIDVPLQNVSKQIGASVTFSVQASGSTNFYYQWKLNDANIAGATGSSLTRNNLGAADEGTYSVTVSNLIGAATSSAVVVLIPPGAWTGKRGDMDFNNSIDILWRNVDPAVGANRVWRMGLNGTNVIDKNYPIQASVSTWQIRCAGDFTGDGKTDLLWQQPGNPSLALWQMDGVTRLSAVLLQKTFATNWTLAASADFNNDGQLDLVWREYTTGANAIWFMNGTNWVSSATPLSATTNWVLAGAADFNGDSKADLLWRANDGTGARPVAIWYMDGATRLSTATLAWSPDVTWEARGVGDFNKDGKNDILWWNNSTGAVSLWFMDNTNRLGTLSLPTEPNLNWQIAGPR
jgi:hypothetical protein